MIGLSKKSKLNFYLISFVCLFIGITLLKDYIPNFGLTWYHLKSIVGLAFISYFGSFLAIAQSIKEDPIRKEITDIIKNNKVKGKFD